MKTFAEIHQQLEMIKYDLSMEQRALQAHWAEIASKTLPSNSLALDHIATKDAILKQADFLEAINAQLLSILDILEHLVPRD